MSRPPVPLSDMPDNASATNPSSVEAPGADLARRGGGDLTAAWEESTTPKTEAQIREAIAVVGWLPVLDRNLLRVLALTDDDEATTLELARSIERDPGLATSVLRYANTEYFSQKRREFTVREAVVMVGRVATRRMCLEAITYEFFELAPGNASMSRGIMYMHALAVANVAYATATRVGAAPDVAHLGGLLHDCGKLIMPYAFDTQALDEIARRYACGEERARLERDAFGTDHAHAGAVFARESGVDAETVAAIAWHHGGASYSQSPSPEAACVQLGDIVVNMMSGTETPGPMLQASLDRLGLTYNVIGDLAADAAPWSTQNENASLSYHIFRLERDANTDELTGIPNRRSVIRTLNDALADGRLGALLLCDVDFFKEVNDTLGHAAGDVVLVEVARLLSRFGLVARLGGDEFVIWAPDGDGEALAAAASEAAAAFHVKGMAAPLGISVGVAPLAGTVSETLAAADKALYRHKVEHHKLRDDAPKAPSGPYRRAYRDALAADPRGRTGLPSAQDGVPAPGTAGPHGFEVRDEHRAFQMLVAPPVEVRDVPLRDAAPADA